MFISNLSLPAPCCCCCGDTAHSLQWYLPYYPIQSNPPAPWHFGFKQAAARRHPSDFSHAVGLWRLLGDDCKFTGKLRGWAFARSQGLRGHCTRPLREHMGILAHGETTTRKYKAEHWQYGHNATPQTSHTSPSTYHHKKWT